MQRQPARCLAPTRSPAAPHAWARTQMTGWSRPSAGCTLSTGCLAGNAGAHQLRRHQRSAPPPPRPRPLAQTPPPPQAAPGLAWGVGRRQGELSATSPAGRAGGEGTTPLAAACNHATRLWVVRPHEVERRLHAGANAGGAVQLHEVVDAAGRCDSACVVGRAAGTGGQVLRAWAAPRRLCAHLPCYFSNRRVGLDQKDRQVGCSQAGSGRAAGKAWPSMAG